MGKVMETMQEERQIAGGSQGLGVITDSGISRLSVGEKQSVFLRLSKKDQRFVEDERMKLRTGQHVPLVPGAGDLSGGGD